MMMRLPLLALVVAVNAPAAALAQDPRPIPPDVRVHRIEALPTPRDILVWLPPGYDTEKERRYPTLYLHDGASPFVIWRLDELAKPLIAARAIEPLIIVFVPNGGGQEERFNEYTPTRPPNAKAGGQAAAYGKALVAVAQARQLRDALVRKGWTLGSDLHYTEVEGATHNDEAFAKRAEAFLKYLFPLR